ncbi:MAG: hypothetical protein H6Q72_2801 [Firmicutes bacterium]|nr:hypothetical protein [Bacillota bacterium]
MNTADFTLTINSITIDTLPLFVQLTADMTSSYKEIDLLYQTDKTRYQLAASRSPYVNHPLFSSGSIDRQIYAAKYLGLLLAAFETGPASTLFQKTIAIPAKYHNELYLYIKNSELIDLSLAADPRYYAASTPGNHYHNLLTGATTHYLQYFVTLYPAIDLPLQASLKFALFMVCALGKRANTSDPATLFMLQVLASPLDNTSEFQLLKKRLNKATVKKMARYLKNLIYQKVFHNYLDPWNGDHYWEGLTHCSAYLSSLTKMSLFSPKLLTHSKERDVELLCRLYIVKMTAELFRANKKKRKEDMEIDCAEFVMFGLSILEFVREYKKTRKYYFEHNPPFSVAEVTELKQQLQAYEAEIQKTNAALAEKTNLLVRKEAEINNLVIQQKFAINALTKENNLLKIKLAETEMQARITDTKTVQPATVINIDTAAKKHVNSEAYLRSLGNIHVLVIGGTENWQTKLKNKFPHFVYLLGDTNNFDETLIVNADIVFANVRYKFSHDCFYKFIKLIRQYDKRLVFLAKTNIALTIQQIANALSPLHSTEKAATLQGSGCISTYE